METHVEVLVSIARKGVDLLAGGRLTAESMPELTYPLERAQAFARGVTPSSGAEPASLVAFRELLARYRDLVDTLDRIRRDQTGDEARRTLSGPLAAVEAAAGRVRDGLRAEGRWKGPQERGSSITRLSSFTVARSDDTD